MAYLIVHSKFFPRLIGVLLAIEGLGYLVKQLLALSCARARSADLPVFRASITLALGRKPEAIRLLPHPPTISKHWAT